MGSSQQWDLVPYDNHETWLLMTTMRPSCSWQHFTKNSTSVRLRVLASGIRGSFWLVPFSVMRSTASSSCGNLKDGNLASRAGFCRTQSLFKCISESVKCQKIKSEICVVDLKLVARNIKAKSTFLHLEEVIVINSHTHTNIFFFKM